MKILKSCDEKPLDFLLADAGDAKLLVGTLVKLLKSVSDATVQQYALTHIEEILQLENLPQVCRLWIRGDVDRSMCVVCAE